MAEPRVTEPPMTKVPSTQHAGARSITPSAAPGGPKRPRWAFAAGALVIAAGAAGVVAARFESKRATERRAAQAPAKTTDGGAPVRWFTDTVPVLLDASLDAIDPAARDAVTTAMQAWTKIGAKAPALQLGATTGATPGYDPSGSNANVVVFAPGGWHAAGAALAVTVATYDATSGALVDADIVVNGKYQFAVLAPGRDGDDGDEVDLEGGHDAHASGKKFDLQNVLTHETGHFLGLAEDWSDKAATMYGKSSPGETHKRALTPDDVGAVTELYLEGATKHAPAGGGCGGASVAPGRGGHGAVAIVAAALGAIGAAAARRRARVGRGAVIGALAAAALLGRSATADAPAQPTGDATAKVLRATSVWNRGVMETTLALGVTRCRASACPAGEQMFVAYGGRIGDLVQTVGGGAVPAAGQEVELRISGAKLEVLAKTPGRVLATRAVVTP